MNIARSSFAALACVATAAFAAGALAATPAMPATPQPELTAIVQPFADGLRKAAIRTVVVRADSTRVRLATEFGPVYFRYPSGLAPTAFAVNVNNASVRVDSDTYSPASRAQYEAALKAVLPEGIRRANANNQMMIQRRDRSR